MSKKNSRTKGQIRKGKHRPVDKRARDKAGFWSNIIRAVEADPRDVSAIRGASGIQHPVLASGVDEKRQRLIIISQDHEARSAAMMQADIQSAFSSIHVIVARPILFNLAGIARNIFEESISGISDDDVQQRVINQVAKQIFITEVDVLELGGMLQYMQTVMDIGKVWEESTNKADNSAANRLTKLMSIEPDAQDNKLGLCPVPLYKFSDKDFELLARGSDIEAAKDILNRLDILQYFFPPPDNLALGLVDRAPINNAPQLIKQLKEAPKLGHPFGDTEIINSKASIPDIIDELRERNLLVEGEIGFELTPEGESIRQTIRFKPREGLLSKIINRFSFNIDLKDLFRSSGNT